VLRVIFVRLSDASYANPKILPDAGAFADARLPAAAGHGHRKEPAAKHGFLDAGDHL
jgi:hypothetical protein